MCTFSLKNEGINQNNDLTQRVKTRNNSYHPLFSRTITITPTNLNILKENIYIYIYEKKIFAAHSQCTYNVESTNFLHVMFNCCFHMQYKFFSTRKNVTVKSKQQKQHLMFRLKRICFYQIKGIIILRFFLLDNGSIYVLKNFLKI